MSVRVVVAGAALLAACAGGPPAEGPAGPAPDPQDPVARLRAHGLKTLPNWRGGEAILVLTVENADRFTDEGAALVGEHVSLEYLTLAGTRVTDAGLEHLVGLERLRELDLSETAITDAGIEALAELRGLQVLRVERTGVSEAGVRRLRAALPDCAIRYAP